MAYQLKRLVATHSLPFFGPDGRFVASEGYDPKTGLYLTLPMEYAPGVPHDPTADDVRQALGVLVSPWRAYTLAGPEDAAALVSAVLMTVCRPVLDVCPAVLWDAAAPGSGKTLGATAMGSLLSGRREGVTPFAGLNDEELVKTFIAGVISGQRFHCWDNLAGRVDSPALAGLLTSGRLQGRVLGKSETVDCEIRALITMTANNASLSAELLRRTLRVRVDSGPAPTARQFNWSPPDVAIRDRLKIAEAACTIWRAYFNAGAPRIAADDAGGWVQWTVLCRQPVLWLAREGLNDKLGWALGDPAACLMAPAEGLDSETAAHGDLMRALHALSGGYQFTARQAVAWFEAGASSADDDPTTLFREAAQEVLGRADVTGRALGKAFAFRRDRVVSGLALRQGEAGSAGLRWRVELVT